ncbi:hypothetical protein D0B54_23840 [Solimonas sp. K1W22B-7]|uniref:c-type cytochrome n=1 Tax=Solimonas sp. K1W22B-7 TaxID=2303331 RepID=UPI000E334B4B|nr:hypothetical protein [Solimonas sp. K1W22B-7]AXQ31531.1 hypothetical protein D0B54_23840 [Solimonas sp. K1W22B-7]
MFQYKKGIATTMLMAAAALTACGSDYSGGTVGSDGGSSPGGGGTAAKDDQGHFSANVAPGMDFCRTCHVQGGVADTDEGRRFMLSSDKSRDYALLKASWAALGRGVESSLILQNASGEHVHSGGSPWPKGSTPYNNMKILLGCWDSPASCAGLLGGAIGGGNTSLPPLLGDLAANGGRNYAAQFCEGKAAATPLPQDPRELISGDNLDNPDYAVWYNDEFEICETPALFENQRKQNEILVSKGMKPIYSAKPRPQTCGEWSAAVERGRKYIMHNAITGKVLTRQSLYNLIDYLGYEIPTDPAAASALLAKVAYQRYGWPRHVYNNPFPLPGEDPNATNGGSLQLPLAIVQMKDDAGKWTGNLGVTCYACHVGQIGKGEVIGNSARRDGHPELYGGGPDGTFVSVNGSNTDTGLALADIERANGTVGPNAFGANLDTPGYMANRTRGSNAADQEIVNVLIGRNLETLDFRNPLLRADVLGKLIPSAPLTGGDQDMPTWWWTHNKTRYLWVGFGSAGSSRGNFFPSSTNNENGHWSKAREGDYQDLDMWLNAVEAPKFVGPAVSTALAEQGAILFHNKDLWADGANSDIPRPPVGNGSCASCHGAYSPRYGQQPGYLPDARLTGYSGATVPMNIIRTDGAQSNMFTALNGATAVAGPYGDGLLAKAWFSYPDAARDFVAPESRPYYGTPFGDLLSDLDPTSAPKDPEQKCKLGTKGGYTAQPLHGVWASAPYLHNGSVPTVWDVLKPDDRPEIWLRQQAPLSEAGPQGERGFDTDLKRAYDYDKLGWKYERMRCDALGRVPYLACSFDQAVPTALDFIVFPFKVMADYFAAPGKDAVNERAVYNTNGYSKSNSGHDFTKELTDPERRALIEYLKTL